MIDRKNNNYTQVIKDENLEDVYLNSLHLNEGSILLANHRAAPETEIGVENDPDKCLQPIVYEEAGLYLT